MAHTSRAHGGEPVGFGVAAGLACDDARRRTCSTVAIALRPSSGKAAILRESSTAPARVGRLPVIGAEGLLTDREDLPGRARQPRRIGRHS